MNTTIAQQIADEGGVEAYLHAQQHKSLLRFLTCGSVDDGKSTLIGRLLHDTRQIYEDQLSTLHNDSKRHGTQGEKLDLALLVDGLQAEREQGITIDVAYRLIWLKEGIWTKNDSLTCDNWRRKASISFAKWPPSLPIR